MSAANRNCTIPKQFGPNSENMFPKNHHPHSHQETYASSGSKYASTAPKEHLAKRPSLARPPSHAVAASQRSGNLLRQIRMLPRASPFSNMTIQISITELLPFAPQLPNWLTLPTSHAARSLPNLFPAFSPDPCRTIAMPRTPSHIDRQTDNPPDFPKCTLCHPVNNPAPQNAVFISPAAPHIVLLSTFQSTFHRTTTTTTPPKECLISLCSPNFL
jgi:hypothetical protein